MPKTLGGQKRSYVSSVCQLKFVSNPWASRKCSLKLLLCFTQNIPVGQELLYVSRPRSWKEIQSLAQIQSSTNCFYATFRCRDSCCYSGVWKSPMGLEYLYIVIYCIGDYIQLTLRSHANSTNYSLDTCVCLPPPPCLIC